METELTTEEPEMENRRNDSRSGDTEAKCHKPICGECDDSPRRRWPRIQLSPITAVGIVSMTLAIGFGLEYNPFESGLPDQQTRSVAEAVDISLQRLMRSRVAQKLEREHRLTGSPLEKRPKVDDELGRLRAHPLYAIMSGMMTQHLRNEGYDRVSIKPTQDPTVFLLAGDAEFRLNKFLHGMRTEFPAPNEKVAVYLRNQEQILGSVIVTQRTVDRYDAAFYFLIYLLCEFPDDLETVTGVVSFHSAPRDGDVSP
jgi:hypothetical protein